VLMIKESGRLAAVPQDRSLQMQPPVVNQKTAESKLLFMSDKPCFVM